MSTSNSRNASICYYLRAAKKLLQNVTPDTGVENHPAKVGPANASAQRVLPLTPLVWAHILEKEASEVLYLIRSGRNRLAPINRLPPEVLVLILTPDFWNKDVKGRDRALIASTRVCRAWRKILISHSCLWTDIDCRNMEKTRAYLERSKSSPINLRLKSHLGLFLLVRGGSILQVIPHAIGRLQSLTIQGEAQILQEITPQLSHPAPVLKNLVVQVNLPHTSPDGPVLSTALFGGDLSSLHELTLNGVRTGLPWRNIVNLRSFTLGYSSPSDSPVRRLLDFFEGAPRLRKISLSSATPTIDTQRGRLVSLKCLKRMDISESGFPSLLLDHLLIPASARFTARVSLPGTIHLPKSFNYIRELSKFRIHMHVRDFYPSIQFGGSAWETRMVPVTPQAPTTCSVLESLAQFNPSGVERATITEGDLMLNHGSDIGRVLLAIRNLRSLTISGCMRLSSFINFLKTSGLCPELEEFILDPRGDREKFNIQNMIELAASRRTKLKSVKIFSQGGFTRVQVAKLEQHVPHVECGPGVALASDDVDSSGEED